ncbi:MAG: ATP phosphoribosyltransferase regulatory subunit [Gammaproteobacteria bacterium]|nr:ATP phosphoribosyltransferase regulatory subunit [Gammaproteobacteria bacterium]
MNKWQLPEGIDELSGSQAALFEVIRRRLLDLYQSWGYELVVPPMVEYVESLILTSGSVDQKTFKFLDPCSGRMLGVHADITPQISRIDSKRSEGDRVARYCYINAILQTKADDFYASRSPIQAGAELYGFKGVDADIEVIEMMISSLSILGIENLTLSLGNTSIFSALTEAAELDSETTATLRDIFKRKSIPDLAVFLETNEITEGGRFKTLISLEGGADVLDGAKQLFSDLPQVIEAVDVLIKLSETFSGREVDLMFDLGEVKAYEYHNGVVFAAYHAEYSKALAQGGRYNGLSQSFGVARDATGFSLDLKFLIQQQPSAKFSPTTLLAPNIDDVSLKAFVQELRSSGVVVKQDIENSNNTDIVKSGSEWTIKD